MYNNDIIIYTTEDGLSEFTLRELDGELWLTQKEIAEDQASMKKQIFLQDWTEKLDAFLAFNDRQVLQTAGTISKTQADEKARIEYEKFATARRLEKEQEGERHIAELLNLKK